ncbi:hypothetical protein BJX61DRAFT_553233 [Aspergillus egyptiacus]|nr:hypothetical protein BJX61DRAFT_553233 [Aspergillus egyptiacus]
MATEGFKEMLLENVRGSLAQAQVDGGSSVRKVKKNKKKGKNKKKKGKREQQHENEIVQEHENEQELLQEQEHEHEHVQGEGEEEVKDEAEKKTAVEEEIIGDENVEEDRATDGEEAPAKPQAGPAIQMSDVIVLYDEQEEAKSAHDESWDRLFCRAHGRLLCQFNRQCCVHKPPSNCGCPPRHSCCCMHHAGDCCHCIIVDGDEQDAVTQDKADEDSPDQDQDQDQDQDRSDGENNDKEDEALSETLSHPTTTTTTTPPPTPPATTTTTAAEQPPTTVPECAPTSTSTAAPASASVSTPAKPSGVKLIVTPPSPSMKSTEPTVIGGAESANIVAAQASLELSKNLIEMMEVGHMTDLRLVLQSVNDNFWPIAFTVHRCVLSRSPLVSWLLQYYYYTLKEPLNVITALAGERFVLIKPWQLVVHYLYGRPVLTMETLKDATLEGLGFEQVPDPVCEPDYPFNLQVAMVDMALGYAVSGAYFYLVNVVEIGFGLAIDLLSWDTVEHVLHFGLCTYKFAVVCPPQLLLGPIDSHNVNANAPMPVDDSAQEADPEKPETATNINGETSTDGETKNDGPPTTSQPLIVSSTPPANGNHAPGSAPSSAETMPAAPPVPPYPAPPFPISELEGDWSRRLVAAALSFIADNITKDFKLYTLAQSTIIPDRIPEYLRTPPPPYQPGAVPSTPPSKPTTSNDKEKDTPTPTPTSTRSTRTTSAAVANNPRLADVKFGSFATDADGDSQSHRDETQSPNDKAQQKAETENQETKPNAVPYRTLPATSDFPTPSPAGLARKLFPPKPKPTGPANAPGAEVTIPSAIFLSLPFAELRLSFSILAKRGVMSARLAQSIILERETRRRAALRNYATHLLANAASATPASASSGSGDAGGSGSGSGGKNASVGAGNRGKAARRRERNNRAKLALNMADLPPVVKELCYREFYSSKMTGRVQVIGERVEERVEVEIVLEREWVGFEG